MRVIIIDDEMNICLSLKNILEDEGHQVDYSLKAQKSLQKVKEFSPDIVLLDVRLDGANGIDILEKILKYNQNIIVIMISGHSGIKEAVKAIKLGAFDFLEKPLSLGKVKIAMNKAVEFNNISKDYYRLKSSIDAQYQIIGESKDIKDLLELINKVSISDSKVLIRGESGTGKELIAYAIHHQSRRRDKPFVKFNSAAIPNELVESELFGFEKGAFTGAVNRKDGKIEQADRGSLFLDEIGDMNLNAQAKVLRVIQEGEFERVGGTKTMKIDTRIIAATHKNLEKLVEIGEFREDLYYRLNVIPIIASPLRSHPEDIPILINYFLNYFAQELKLSRKIFNPETIQEIQSWEFKGNVRELKNFIERVYILIEQEQIGISDIQNLPLNSKETNFWNQTLFFKDKRREFEKKYLQTQLRLYGGNISKTA